MRGPNPDAVAELLELIEDWSVRNDMDIEMTWRGLTIAQILYCNFQDVPDHVIEAVNEEMTQMIEDAGTIH